MRRIRDLALPETLPGQRHHSHLALALALLGIVVLSTFWAFLFFHFDRTMSDAVETIMVGVRVRPAVAREAGQDTAVFIKGNNLTLRDPQGACREFHFDFLFDSRDNTNPNHGSNARVYDSFGRRMVDHMMEGFVANSILQCLLMCVCHVVFSSSGSLWTKVTRDLFLAERHFLVGIPLSLAGMLSATIPGFCTRSHQKTQQHDLSVQPPEETIAMWARTPNFR